MLAGAAAAAHMRNMAQKPRRQPHGLPSREQILEKIYGPGHHGTARTIDNFLMQLRSKLEDDPQAPKHLVTVRGVGYRLVP